MSDRTSHPLSRRTLFGGALAVGAGLLLTACGSSGSGSGSNAQSAVSDNGGAASPYQGVLLPRTFDKPDVTLTDTSGKPYDLVQRTAGRAMLLYFGYTPCPDVCPTTMGDIAVALSKLPAAQQQQIDVVFISTDPTVDTPSTIQTWLNSFNPKFIGLTGDINTIIKAAQSVGVYVAAPKAGQEPVHGAEVLGFFPSDNKAHVLYTSGVPWQDFAHDLPLMIRSVSS